MLPVVDFISRARTSLKLKQNKTVDSRCNEAPTVDSGDGLQITLKI